jgi:hypothetical protein
VVVGASVADLLAARVLADAFREVVVVDGVWRMAVGADFEFPGTEGPKPRGTDLFNRYLTRLIRTTYADGQVADERPAAGRLALTPRRRPC